MNRLELQIANGINYIGITGSSFINGRVFVQKLTGLFKIKPFIFHSYEKTLDDVTKEINAISSILMFKENIGWEEAKQRVYDVIAEWIFEEENIDIE